MSFYLVHRVMKDIIRKSGGKNIPYFPTGSRVIGGATEESDWDMVLQAQDVNHMHKISAAIEEVFDYDTRYGSTISDQYGISIKVYLDGKPFNFIIVPNDKQASIWKYSTRVAVGLQLKDKDLRVHWFEKERERLSPFEEAEVLSAPF